MRWPSLVYGRVLLKLRTPKEYRRFKSFSHRQFIGDSHNGSAGAFEALCGGSIPSSPTIFTMQEAHIIINKLIESIKTIDSNKAIPNLIKDIDKHVQDAYSELYKYKEQKSVYKPLNDNKRGHCC